MNQIFLFLLLSAGLAANVVWTIYLFRKNKVSRPMSSSDISNLDARVERLLTEIHRVTSANVELLEGRIEALREVGGLADERLKRIRTTLTDLEVLLNRVSRVKNSLEQQSPSAETASASAPAARTRSEIVCGLYRQGLTERQIAQKTGLGVAEIRFLLKLANAENVERTPVERR